MRVCMFRNFMDVSIVDLMMQRFDDQATEAFISEYCLLTQLLGKISSDRAVENRWIPVFSPPVRDLNGILNRRISEYLKTPAFEVGGSVLAKPKTIGQWFLTVLIERVRRRRGTGIGLRTLIYCVTWCARLIEDRDFQRLELSAAMIKA